MALIIIRNFIFLTIVLLYIDTTHAATYQNYLNRDLRGGRSNLFSTTRRDADGNKIE